MELKIIPTLVQHFIRLAFCLQCAQYLVEHEVDKRTRIALSCGFTDSIVVLALMRPYNIFDRRTVEFIAPGAKKRSLPETSRPSVAVWERMDELELVMENTGQHSENEDHGIWSHHFMGNR